MRGLLVPSGLKLAHGDELIRFGSHLLGYVAVRAKRSCGVLLPVHTTLSAVVLLHSDLKQCRVRGTSFRPFQGASKLLLSKIIILRNKNFLHASMP